MHKFSAYFLIYFVKIGPRPYEMQKFLTLILLKVHKGALYTIYIYFLSNVIAVFECGYRKKTKESVISCFLFLL